jgi:hypothetical protein
VAGAGTVDANPATASPVQADAIRDVWALNRHLRETPRDGEIVVTSARGLSTAQGDSAPAVCGVRSRRGERATQRERLAVASAFERDATASEEGPAFRSLACSAARIRRKGRCLNSVARGGHP